VKIIQENINPMFCCVDRAIFGGVTEPPEAPVKFLGGAVFFPLIKWGPFFQKKVLKKFSDYGN
jgi:hypothetical protein